MKQAAQISTIAGANIAINFLFQWYVLKQLGAGFETDSFIAGLTIPQILLAIINGALVQVLIPIFTSKDVSQRQLEACSLIAFVGAIVTCVCIILFLSAPFWSTLIFPGFDEFRRKLTIDIINIQLISVIFASISAIQTAVYHAQQKFLFTESISIIVSSISFLFLIWLLPKYGVIAAAWCMTLRIVLQFLILSSFVEKLFWPDIKNPVIALTWDRIKPLIFGSTYYMADPIIDRFLLSTASIGSLSLFNFAQQIYGALSEIINKSVGAPLITRLTKLYKEEDIEGFKQAYFLKLRKIILFSLFLIFLIIIFGKNLISIFIDNKELFNLNLFSLIIILMIGRFLLGNVGIILTSVFYSIGDTKTPTRVGVISFTIGIVIKIIMFYFFGIIGLALAVTFYYIIYILLFRFFMRKNYWCKTLFKKF